VASGPIARREDFGGDHIGGRIWSYVTVNMCPPPKSLAAVGTYQS
jgi:hypothetical protein